MAETVSDPARLEQLSRLNTKTPNFEALFEVLGMDSLEMNGKMLATSPINASNLWSGP